MGFLHPGPIAFLPSSSDRPQSKPRLSRMDDPELPGFNSTRGLVPHSRFHTPARNAREHTNCPAHASFQGPFKPLRCSLFSAHSTLLGSFCAMPSGRETFTEPRDFLTGAPEFLFALPLEAQLAFLHFASTHLFAHQSAGSLSAWTGTLLYGSATSTVCSHVHACTFTTIHTHSSEPAVFYHAVTSGSCHGYFSSNGSDPMCHRLLLCSAGT